MSADLSIRKYLPGDRETLRRIAYETALFGKPELFVNDKEILADALTLYFTDYEPESCFVVTHGKDVVGYLTGTVDALRMNKISRTKIMVSLFFKALKRRLLWKRTFVKFTWQALLSYIKGEFRNHNYHAEYPALFHINLDEQFRNEGLGSRLIKEFENYLQDKHVRGILVGTISDRAKIFFMKNGYRILFKTRRSYLVHELNTIYSYYILGKNLNNARQSL